MESEKVRREKRRQKDNQMLIIVDEVTIRPPRPRMESSLLLAQIYLSKGCMFISSQTGDDNVVTNRPQVVESIG